MSGHKRNTAPMLASPRCGARTRSGAPCRAPAVAGKKRCRMHGGAKGSGAPRATLMRLSMGVTRRRSLNGDLESEACSEKPESSSERSSRVSRATRSLALPTAGLQCPASRHRFRTDN